jgi:mannosyl-oligosaccharide alpha-1,2-mannosidase
LFETTIRYVAGLISAFELSNEQFPILVSKAKEVADKMAFAWTSPVSGFVYSILAHCLTCSVQSQDVPFHFINFNGNIPSTDTVSLPSIPKSS